jgi:O-antigen ligase
MNKNWQYWVVEYLAYFLVVFVPLCFSGHHMFIFNSPKIIAISAIVLLMVIFKLFGDWNRNFKIRFSFLGIFLSLFVLALIVSSLLGIDPLNSFFGWRGGLTPLVSICALFIFSFIVASLVREDKKVARRLLIFSFLTSILVMLIFYFNSSTVNMNEGSTLGNSSYLGAYILFNIFFGLYLFLSAKNKNKIWPALGILFLIINPLFINLKNIGSIFSDPLSLLGIANGATLGIFISTISIVFLFMIFSKKKYLKISGMILMFLFVLSIFWTAVLLSTPETRLYKGFTEAKTSNRFLVWDIAKEGFKEKPVLGNGFNNYIYTFDRHYNPNIYEEGYALERFFKPHNIFWEILSEVGLVGLITYAGLLVCLFVVFLRKKEGRTMGIVLSGLLVGYVVQNLFVFDSVTTYMTFYLVVAIGLAFSSPFEKEFKFKNKYFYLPSIVIAIYLMHPLVFAPLKESRSMMKITAGEYIKDLSKQREGIQGISLFGGVMDDTYQSGKLSDLYQKKLYLAEGENKDIFLKELNSLYLYMEESIRKQPNYSESYLVTSGILNLYMMVEMKEGKNVVFNGTNYNADIWQKSFENISKSLELNPKNPASYLVLSQLFMLKADLDQAFQNVRESISLAPSNKEAYSFGRFLLKVKQDKDFENFLNERENKDGL